MNRAKRLLLYAFMGLSTFSAVNSIQGQDICSFKHTTISAHFFNNVTRIECCKGSQKIGYLYCTKIPCLPFYVIYDFYIHRKHRNKGHGTQLLNYACDHLKSQGASKIYVQPGPFEIQGTHSIDASSHALKLQRLVKFYKQSQFVVVNTVLQYLAYILYKCMGIDEDSRYLMVRALK